MIDPGGWWVFQPRGRRRPPLTPLGLAWTVGFYGLLGLATAMALKWLVEVRSPAGPVLLVLFGSAAWTGLRVAIDGRLVRGAAWLMGFGPLIVVHLLTEAPACGTLIFGGGLPGVSPGIAACQPHTDFMATLFVAGWAALGPLAALVSAWLELERWRRLRRDPLGGFRLLPD